MTESHSTPRPEASRQEPSLAPAFGEESQPGWLSHVRVPEKAYWGLLVLLLGLIGWAYSRLIDTEILGFTHDDGVYAVAAKALAMGKGFSLLHVIGEPAQIKYPVLYPLLLAPVWWIEPRFPENLMGLNYVTMAFGLAGLGLTYGYVRDIHRFPGWLALLVIVLSAASFFFMYFFSTVMSEAPYLFFSVLTLWVCQQQCRKHGAKLPFKSLLWVIILSALTFHTRVLGVTLMAAVGAWLLLHRQWKTALSYGVGTFVLGVLPWVLWVKLKTPPVTDLTFPLVSAYSNYGLEFFHNFSAQKAGSYFAGLLNDFVMVMYKLLEDMIPLIPNFFKVYPQLEEGLFFPLTMLLVTMASVYLLNGYYLLQVISTVRKSFAPGRFSAELYSVSGLYLVFYVTLITLWRYEDQMARFLAVLLPLTWLYFFKPMLPFLANFPWRPGPGAWRNWGVLLLIVSVTVITLLPAPNSYRIVYKSRTEHWVDSGKNKWLWDEYKATFAWVKKNLPQDAAVGASSDVVFYLYTGRPTFYVFYASLQRAHGRYLPDSFDKLMRSLDHHGVRYLVVEPHMQFRTVLSPENLVAKELMRKHPERFKQIYASPQSKVIRIYEILPDNA